MTALREHARVGPADRSAPAERAGGSEAGGGPGPDPRGGADALEVRRPGDGSLVARVPVMGAPEVDSAVRTARSVQEEWASRSARSRARVLDRLGHVLADRAEEIAERVRDETGKPRTEALAEVAVSGELLQYYVRIAPKALANRSVGSGWLLNKRGWVEREAHGVVGAILPWNYPFIMVMDVLAPALAAGNALVVKPSEHTPWSALLVPDLCRAAGVPEGLVQVVTGDGATGAALVAADIDKISFTGSTATGRKVMAAAARHPIPVVMELGGKDPAIVLADADLERAARGVAYGGFFNAGQTCISVERVLVERPVYDRFLELLAAEARSLRVGTGDDADVGPMVNQEQFDIVNRQVRDALAGGARAVTGGAPGTGRLYPPTILVDVAPDADVATEETFGPVVTVTPVADEDEAVERANALGYGLFASVWTGDRDRGVRVARRLVAGGVSVNDVLSHYALPGLPVGGRGPSGFGSRRGREGLEEMVRNRTMLVDRIGLGRELWWFPYRPVGERLVAAVTEWRARRGLSGLVGGLRTLAFGPRRDAGRAPGRYGS